MTTLPAGRVTFLFTDIEGSTALFRRLGDDYARLLEAHRRLVREAVQRKGGVELGTEGDSFFVVFVDAKSAVEACLDAQLTLVHHDWPEDSPIRVRMGIHTGEATPTGEDYIAMAVHQAARVQSAAHGGQVLLTQEVLEAAGELPRELTVRDLGFHTLKDFPSPVSLYQLCHHELPDEFPAIKTLSVLADNLPIARTSFVGREQEVEAIRSLLESSPLVTLTGAGGSGKTRLALEVAKAAKDRFAHGVRLVEFASLGEPELIGATVSRALGIREGAERSTSEALIDFCRDRRLLLVLDNCEHLVDSCADLTVRLLDHCSELRVLATSREALAVSGEQVYSVPTLKTPERIEGLDRSSVAKYEAVRLFADRARAVNPAFTLNDENFARVARICGRLDAIPLAIELAAARLKTLSLEQIDDKLADRFRLLTTGVRGASARQQTLRAAVDWSYDLLTAGEQRMLCGLSVFAGGFTLAAAEAVGSGEGTDEADVMDLVSRLVGKSLVSPLVQDAGERFQMLETIREYAAEKLHESGRSSETRLRHLSWLRRLSVDAETAFRAYSGAELVWLDAMDSELDNVRAGLEAGFVDGLDPSSALQVVVDLEEFWLARHPAEGRRWLELGLSRVPARTPTRAKALALVAELTQEALEFERSRAPAEESFAIARELGDRRLLACALTPLSYVAHFADRDNGRAQDLMRECLDIGTELSDKRIIGDALYQLGQYALREGDADGARDFIERSVAVARELNDKMSLPNALDWLGLAVMEEGDLSRARSLFDEALEHARAFGDAVAIAMITGHLGEVAAREKDLDRARSMHEQALSIWEDQGMRDRVTWAHLDLARIDLARGDLESARSCLVRCLPRDREAVTAAFTEYVILTCAQFLLSTSELEAAARAIGYAETALGDAVRRYRGHEETVSRLEAQLPAARYEAARSEGASMTREQALNYFAERLTART